MLARSYASIDDSGNAARHYQWMADHRDAFLRSCKDEEGPVWVGDSRKEEERISAGIHACLVDAYDSAGELDKAIGAAEAWIDACPDHLGVFDRMARLQQKRPDPIAAAKYMQKEADIREALGDQAFANDPKVRIILDLGWIISTTRLDETLKNIASTHPHEHSLAESLIRNYWPAFDHLNTDDRQRWVTGSWLLGTSAPQGAGIAVHCFARIVEGELRTNVFAPFAGYARSHPELLAHCRDDDKSIGLFCRYLKGRDKNIGLGPMFRVFGFARHPTSPVISSFAEWLKRDHPWLLSGLKSLETSRIVDFRNREDHPDLRIETHEAEQMSRICRQVIDLLHPR
jgi:hypothetical protein